MGEPSIRPSFSNMQPGQRKIPQKIFWVTPAIAELFDREYYLLVLSREFIFYLIFFFCVSFAAFAKLDFMSYYLTHAVRSQLIQEDFKTDSNKFIRFNDITTINHFYDYLDELVVKKIFIGSFSSLEFPSANNQTDRGLLYYNKILGQPTLRQVTAKNSSCHQIFSEYFKLCYLDYSDWTKSKENLNSKEFAYKYRPQYKIKNETKMVGTQAISYWGKLAFYEAGGYQKRMGISREQFKENIELLRASSWYRPETRAIFFDVQFYNQHVDLFTVVKLIFETPPTGQLIPTASITTFQCEKEYTNKLQRLADGCMIVYSLFILYFLCEEFRQIYFFKWAYLGMFWIYVNWIILITSMVHLLSYLTEKIHCWYYYSEYISSINVFYPLQELARLETTSTNAQAVAVLFVYLKLLKYCCLNTHLGHLYHTLSTSGRALRDLFFLIIIVLFAFASCGHIFFGSQVEEFSTLSLTMTTLLRTFVGDFNYSSLEKYYWRLAPVYFTIIVVLIFIVANLFLAILCAYFMEVKTDMGIAPFRIQMCGFWGRGCTNSLKDCGCKSCLPKKLSKKRYSASAEEIRTILKRCGFSDLDIDMFMARYNIDPHQDIRRQDVSRLIESMRTPTVEINPAKDSHKPYIYFPISEKSTDWRGVKPERVIGLDDYRTQQNRIDRVENIMGVISEKLEKILKIMNTLDERSRGRAKK
ncbi:polycystin-2-like [Onthophagus taurus]|uniref:polycystin-2-like n=1 Tax=Onthophagus taurus TaxID=166361 RepID=UPI0039BE6D2A